MSVVKMATPGIVLGSTAEAKSGPGTHVIQGTIYASLVGLVQTKKEGDQVCLNPSSFYRLRTTQDHFDLTS